MKADIEECKNKIAGANNFDSFKRAIHYTFGRELLQSEDEFINKIINESMEEYASIKCKELEEENKKLKGGQKLLLEVFDRGDKSNKDLAITTIQLLENACDVEIEDQKLAVDIVTETLSKCT